jgi:hypothetical protein
MKSKKKFRREREGIFLMFHDVERTGDKTNAYRVLIGKPE